MILYSSLQLPQQVKMTVLCSVANTGCFDCIALITDSYGNIYYDCLWSFTISLCVFICVWGGTHVSECTDECFPTQFVRQMFLSCCSHSSLICLGWMDKELQGFACFSARGLQMPTGDWHLGPHAWVACTLPNEPSHQPNHFLSNLG